MAHQLEKLQRGILLPGEGLVLGVSLILTLHYWLSGYGGLLWRQMLCGDWRIVIANKYGLIGEGVWGCSGAYNESMRFLCGSILEVVGGGFLKISDLRWDGVF